MLEVALTEKQFKGWPSHKQRQWLKDHPTSKFGKHETPHKTKKPNIAQNKNHVRKSEETDFDIQMHEKLHPEKNIKSFVLMWTTSFGAGFTRNRSRANRKAAETYLTKLEKKIPKELKQVPSDYVYRVVRLREAEVESLLKNLESGSDTIAKFKQRKYSSYSFSPKATQRFITDEYDKKDTYIVVRKKVKPKNMVLNIPALYAQMQENDESMENHFHDDLEKRLKADDMDYEKKRKFLALNKKTIKSEQEVIVKNDDYYNNISLSDIIGGSFSGASGKKINKILSNSEHFTNKL